MRSDSRTTLVACSPVQERIGRSSPSPARHAVIASRNRAAPNDRAVAAGTPVVKKIQTWAPLPERERPTRRVRPRRGRRRDTRAHRAPRSRRRNRRPEDCRYRHGGGDRARPSNCPRDARPAHRSSTASSRGEPSKPSTSDREPQVTSPTDPWCRSADTRGERRCDPRTIVGTGRASQLSMSTRRHAAEPARPGTAPAPKTAHATPPRRLSRPSSSRSLAFSARTSFSSRSRSSSAMSRAVSLCVEPQTDQPGVAPRASSISSSTPTKMLSSDTSGIRSRNAVAAIHRSASWIFCPSPWPSRSQRTRSAAHTCIISSSGWTIVNRSRSCSRPRRRSSPHPAFNAPYRSSVTVTNDTNARRLPTMSRKAPASVDHRSGLINALTAMVSITTASPDGPCVTAQ